MVLRELKIVNRGIWLRGPGFNPGYLTWDAWHPCKRQALVSMPRLEVNGPQRLVGKWSGGMTLSVVECLAQLCRYSCKSSGGSQGATRVQSQRSSLDSDDCSEMDADCCGDSGAHHAPALSPTALTAVHKGACELCCALITPRRVERYLLSLSGAARQAFKAGLRSEAGKDG